jgi:hypothetical protein
VSVHDSKLPGAMDAGSPVVPPEAEADFLADVDAAMPAFDIRPVDGPAFAEETSVRDLRRSRRSRSEDAVGRMSLIESGGVLRWTVGGGPAPARLRRGGRRRGGGRGDRRGEASGRIVRQFKFRDLPPNAIARRLVELDGRLTPNQGLRNLSSATSSLGEVLRSDVAPPPEGRVLLLVHGTFSRAENLVEELRATDAGRALLADWLHGDRYDRVMAFNHPTLSTSPVLNAARIAAAFRGSRAEVDIVAHSRGGLVTRWWREWLDQRDVAPGRAVLVGSPLAGTSLAAPARLRHSLDLITNFSRAMTTVSRATGAVLPMAAPFATAAAVLFGLVGRVTSLAARTPILDAGVSMIPGLDAQSREGANDDVIALREGVSQLAAAARRDLEDRTWIVRSNFEPEQIGWRFWRVFRGLGDRALDAASDIVFPGENDLVVDTDSMADLADGHRIARRGHVLDFGTSSEVHHCNYFQQERTIELLRAALPPRTA